MSLENLKLGMGLGKALYQKVPTTYVPFDGFERRDTNFAAIVLLGIMFLWGLNVV